MSASKPQVSGRFLSGNGGPLATVLWQPPPDIACRFAALYLPPAGDEMNKSRRMAALQARALASIGGNVAMVDPRGTGDSAGEHIDATWEGWRQDALVAWEWLQTLAPVPRVLWGLRLGGLLAADLVASGSITPAALLLWQPVTSGRTFFNQFLRLATAQQLTGGGVDGVSAKALRASLAVGSAIEVAGYDLNPALVAGAETVDFGRLSMPENPIIWRETTIGDPGAISPAAAKVAGGWTQAGAPVDLACVNGPSFWATQEIAEAPELITATTRAVAGLPFAREDPRS